MVFVASAEQEEEEESTAQVVKGSIFIVVHVAAHPVILQQIEHLLCHLLLLRSVLFCSGCLANRG